MKLCAISMMIGVLTIIFLLTGCNRNEPTYSSESFQSQEETTSLEMETESEVQKKDYYDYTESWIRYEYLEYWIELSSHIMEAKCIDIFDEGRYTYLLFEPIEVLRGTFSEDKIMVRRDSWNKVHYIGSGQEGDFIPNLDYAAYYEYKNYYEVGEEYLLVLSETADVYDSYDSFYIRANIRIVATEEDEFLSDWDTIYRKFPILTNETTNFNYDYSYGYEELKQCIFEYSMQYPPKPNELNFIHSEKLEDIVAQTPIIVKGNVTSLLQSKWNDGTKRQTCTFAITETLKGEKITGEIKVEIPRNSVEVGAGYIFMIYDFGQVFEDANDISKLWGGGFKKIINIPSWFLGTRYKMSSRHSLYSVTDTNKVQEIETLIEQLK